jgi:hypothetical protein
VYDTYHFNSVTNYVSSVFPYQTFDNDTVLIGAQGPWSTFVLLWIIIHCHSAILKFVAPRRHFLSAKNILAVNIPQLMMNFILTLLPLAEI